MVQESSAMRVKKEMSIDPRAFTHRKEQFMAAYVRILFGSGIMLVLFFLMVIPSAGQIAPPAGIRQNTPTVHALTGATIVTAPGKVVKDATVVIRDGIIQAVGHDIPIPPDARIWDLKGMTVYAGFIDSYSDYGMPQRQRPSFGPDQPPTPRIPEAPKGPGYWNERVAAAVKAEEVFTPDAKVAEKLRNAGFTSAVLVPQKGVFRGADALIDLGDASINEMLVKTHLAQNIAFETARGDGYPNSLMGAIALIRQTLLDAQWYREAMAASARYPSEPRPEVDDDLAALEDVVTDKLPVIFETGDELMAFRAAAIASEFHLHYLLRGSGVEFRRLQEIRSLGVPEILPINFPDAPSVQTPEEAMNVSTEDLRTWDLAPENPGRLHSAGVTFALTASQLKDPASFLPNLRKAVQRGLPADAALAALTTVPAKLFGVDKEIGTLETGKLANFIIADGDIFNEKTKLKASWINGRRYELKTAPAIDPRGTWEIASPPFQADSLKLVLSGEPDALQGTLKMKGREVKLSSASIADLRLALSFNGDSVRLPGIVRMTAVISENSLDGSGERPDGSMFTWKAARTAPFTPPKDTTKPKPVEMSTLAVTYPPGPFGRTHMPVQPAHILVRDATVWTCGPQGTLEHADVLIEKGVVRQVGRKLTAPAGAVIIDGKGKDVTPGLIDCHSHTAISGGVNETGKTITSDARIGDVIDADDIAVYRELAGGLTVANVLHGSANPIGGQNQVIKLRWGALPEEMKFAGAKPGIKFALGENPKQSNWGDRYQSRYPQTREGVEQIIRDEFKAALDYDREWKEYKAGTRKIPPRRNLQSEAILELIQGKRIIHSHSYRQDEIEMLIRVANDFGIHVGTFQHVLEGYKVADLIARDGAGASTFSDWWAYKFEVIDAIPYNGALMHDASVVVSFNSDSDELARRLNTEAAKAVKYGGLSEQDALKFVTINPAKQLRIDNRVGSIEPGKDADFVVWSGNPLSTLSMCEQTWIDGRKYFDRDEDRAMNEQLKTERASLIQKILKSGKPAQGEGMRQPPRPPKETYSCHEEYEKEGN